MRARENAPPARYEFHSDVLKRKRPALASLCVVIESSVSLVLAAGLSDLRNEKPTVWRCVGCRHHWLMPLEPALVE